MDRPVNAPLSDDTLVDCIVRFHDPMRLLELTRCVFSLYGQQARPLHIIVVTQRFPPDALTAVEAALAPILNLPDAPACTVINYPHAEPADARSALLNLGIQQVRGRYLGFLDYDDTLYPEAYALLIDRMRRSGAALAFASVRPINVSVHAKEGFVYPIARRNVRFDGEGLDNLMTGNFCPLHSYLIDRHAVAPTDLWFDTSLTLEEDYDLLLRLASSYPCDFTALGTEIGDYCFKTDGSNSTTVGAALDPLRASSYRWTLAQMQARRYQLELSALRRLKDSH